MTEPGRYDLRVLQGATFAKTLTWKNASGTPRDLTGWTARLQIRGSDPDATPLVSLTSPSSGITLGGAAGTITLRITDVATAALSFDLARYDLELVAPGGDVTRLLEGKVTLDREVTR